MIYSDALFHYRRLSLKFERDYLYYRRIVFTIATYYGHLTAMIFKTIVISNVMPHYHRILNPQNILYRASKAYFGK